MSPKCSLIAPSEFHPVKLLRKAERGWPAPRADSARRTNIPVRLIHSWQLCVVIAILKLTIEDLFARNTNGVKQRLVSHDR